MVQTMFLKDHSYKSNAGKKNTKYRGWDGGGGEERCSIVLFPKLGGRNRYVYYILYV